MRCPTCDHESPYDTQFCGNCGAQLLPTDQAPLAAKKNPRSGDEGLGIGSVFAERYQVIEELGKGGMGRVYKVLDREIDEKVALKVLNPGVADDEKTVERFRNELKLARKISHRNVCRMYDLSMENGKHYITMEYVPGEDLKSSIRRMGPLSYGKAISIAKQVCGGLAEAHRLGVVHRDLKPQNIMVDREGNARIMDFGIARSLKTKGITETGVMIGTPEYMSVEQVEAKEVDQRSDIYSLGVILYEMVTGRVPFEGDTPLSVAVKHTTEPPTDPREINPLIPDDLSLLILKCMEKRKEDRYGSAEQVRTELSYIEKGLPTTERESPTRKPTTTKQLTVSFSVRRSSVPALAIVALILMGVAVWQFFLQKATVSLPMEKPSLAVLYFENDSGDKIMDHWRAGLAELLTADLRQSKLIRVISADRTFGILSRLNLLDAETYSTGDLKRVATRGRVGHVLKGSFSTDGKNLVVTATLQNPHTGLTVSSRRVDCNGEEEIPAKIDELTKRIKSDLGLSSELLSGDIDKHLTKIASSSPEAFRCYLDGLTNHRQGGDAHKTIELTNRAIALDPGFATAYRVKAEASSELGLVTDTWNCLQKALQLKDRLTTRDFHLAQGQLCRMSEETYDKAIKAYNRLLDIYPEDGEANSDLGQLFCYDLELWDKAIERFGVPIRNNEENGEPYVGQAEAYMAKGMYDQARRTLETYLSSFPDQGWVHEKIANVYLCKRKLDLALREMDKTSSASFHPSLAGDIYHCEGDLARAEEEYQKILKTEEPSGQCYGSFRLAALHLSRGEFERSKEQLEKASATAQKAGDIRWSLWSHVSLAQLYLASGQPEQALKEWENLSRMASRQDLDWEPDLHLKGLIYLQMKSIDQAQKTADQLKKIVKDKMNPKLMRYYHHLRGMIELERGNSSLAATFFKRALSSVPFQHSELDDQALFIYPLALAFYQAGDLERSQEQLVRLVNLTTGRLFFGDLYAKSLYQLGKIQQEKGWHQQAAEFYGRLITLWENADPGIPELSDAKKRLAQLESQTRVFGQSEAAEPP
jgi:serine/threonine protein kinase/tetratricopeptide (TPR) repeat protein